MARFQRVSAAVPLLAGFLLPGLSWAAAIAPSHHHDDDHHHEGAAHGDSRAAASARALLHGHAHPAGVPDHEHRPLVSAPFRVTAPPPAHPDAAAPARDLPPARLAACLGGHVAQALCGTGPPRDRTLSVLRI